MAGGGGGGGGRGFAGDAADEFDAGFTAGFDVFIAGMTLLLLPALSISKVGSLFPGILPEM